MAGKKDIVEQALKLITGGVKEAGPSVAERAAKNAALLKDANRLGVNTGDIGALSETKALTDFHKKFMGDVKSRAAQALEVQKQLREQGAFPLEIGSRFTTAFAREKGQGPHTVQGYFVNPQDPYNSYGYRVRQDLGNDDWQEYDFFIRDPKAEARLGPEKWKEYQEGIQPFTPLRSVKADGGRIAKGPGGWLDDVVSMAGKLVAGEGEQAAKTGIRAYQGSPHDFAAERLVRFPDGRIEYLVGQPDVLPDVPQGAEVLQDFPLGRMRMDKIGTGEGAQAYGHGLYAAEAEPTARGYRDALTDRASSFRVENIDMPKWILRGIEGSPDRAGTIAKYREDFQNRLLEAQKEAEGSHQPWLASGRISSAKDILAGLDALERGASLPHTSGRMYEVNIAADPNTFLDWDKPLSEQPEAIKKLFPSVEEAKSLDAQMDKLSADVLANPDDKALQVAWDEAYRNPRQKMARMVLNDFNPKLGGKFSSGNQLYSAIASKPSEASSFLKEAGIPGIKYLDAGSRGTVPPTIKPKDGKFEVYWGNDPRPVDTFATREAAEAAAREIDGRTRNYVVFDENLISIIRKYGIAGASAMLGYNLMENLDPKQALAATMADKDYQAGAPQKANGGSVREGYSGKGRVVGNIVDQALKLIAGTDDVSESAIRAYHGSPYKFKSFKFTPREIGSGEGAQAYGYGGYFAESEPLAESYTKARDWSYGGKSAQEIYDDLYKISRERNLDNEGWSKLNAQRGFWERVLTGRSPRSIIMEGKINPDDYGASDLAYHKTLKPEKFVRNEGNMYEVEIGADPKIFIDWDKLINEQPEAFKEYIRDQLKKQGYLRSRENGPRQLSSALKSWNMEKGSMGETPVQSVILGRGNIGGGTSIGVAKDLQSLGLPGVKFLDSQSRGLGTGTRNYVVFPGNEDLVKIIRSYAEGGSVKDEDSWLDAAMTVARNAADKATFGTSKYAAAGADYLTDAALDALGYENDADFDRALAEQEYAMKEGEEKNPAAAGAGDIIGYVAPYLAIGPAEGALTTLGYLSDYGGKVGKTGSLFARALGFADGGEVPEQGYLESVGTAINQAANPVRRLIGVRTVDLPEGVDEVDYEELMNLAADVLDKSMLGFGGADPYAKRPKKFPVSPTGKIVDRVLPEEDDIDGALRIAKDVGGGLTPEEVGRRAAQDPATFDAIMQKYAIPDRDIAEYEALKSTVAKQPQDIQQMTHVGAPPMRDVKVDMPLFGGEYNIGSAPYNVAQGMSGAAQTAYDFKTAPLYMTPMTAPIGAGLDVAEGVATGDPLQASMAALGAPGKMAKGAIIGLSNYAMDPAEAQAGKERFFSKLLRTAEELPMEKMTGQQALAMLRKGASPEELRWTGTEDFLANTPQVTKQNLIDYINKNRVQLNEIRLGGSGKPTNLEDIDIMDIPAEIRDRHPEIYRLSNKVEGLRDELVKLRSMPDQSGLDYYDNFRAVSLEFSASQAELARAKDAMRKEYAESIGGLDQPVKFGPGSSYGESLTTPGGKNYSENLFALPKRDIYTPFVEQMRKDIWQQNYNEAIAGGFDEGRARKFADSFNHLNLSPEKMAKFLGKEDELKSVYQAQKSFEPQYKGGHWSDVSPDVLFHTRTSELTYEPPGANRPYRVHNVEETQSDPGQAGRKRGFKDQKAMAEVARLRQNTQELREKLKSEQARIHAEHQERMAPYVEARTNYERELRDKYKRGEISLGDMNRLAFAYFSPESELTRKFRSDTDQIVNPLRNQIVANENEIARIGKNIGDIPAMPYVTSTEKWTDFAIKKELDRAFDNGSDYFSWTPGEAQAERFDLSRHIGKVEYNPDDGSLMAYDPNGRRVVSEGIGNPSELDEYVGKELADKIRAEEENRRYSIKDAYGVDKDEETGKWGVSLYGEPSYDYNGDQLLFDSKGEAKDYINEILANDFAVNPVTLEGLDLKVGGEGMRGYYDKLYLKRVQNVLKESTGIKPEIEVIEVNTPDGPRKQLGVRLTDEMREKARFSDFNKGGRVTGGNSYGNDQSIANALALTREY